MVMKGENRKMSKNAMEIEGKQGNIKISNDVIMVIVQHAANEIEGIISVTGGLSQGLTEAFVKESVKGVKVDHEEKQLEINLTITVAYGSVIPALLNQLQQRIKNDIENMTGIDVAKVNVFVQDIVI